MSGGNTASKLRQPIPAISQSRWKGLSRYIPKRKPHGGGVFSLVRQVDTVWNQFESGLRVVHDKLARLDFVITRPQELLA